MTRKNYESPETEVLAVVQEKHFLVYANGYGGNQEPGQNFDPESAHIYTDDF